jgi:hypothetical protein
MCCLETPTKALLRHRITAVRLGELLRAQGDSFRICGCLAWRAYSRRLGCPETTFPFLTRGTAQPRIQELIFTDTNVQLCTVKGHRTSALPTSLRHRGRVAGQSDVSDSGQSSC